MRPHTSSLRIGFVVIGALLAGCSAGGDDADTDVTVDTTDVSDTPDDQVDEPSEATPTAESSAEPVAADSSVEEVLAAAPVPDLVDPDATRACERWGYACDPLAVSDEVLERTLAAMGSVADAMDGVDDAHEQLRLGLVAVVALEGVGHVEADLDAATMLSFTIDGGPKASVLTVAGELQEGGEVAPVDESFVPEPGQAQGFAGAGFRAVLPPARYEPAGGPATARSAAVYNPFEWESGGDIAAIFQAEDEYTTVDVFNGRDVTPWTVADVASYDAVHIITHGGGSCPSWTDDRSQCSSVFLGGPATVASIRADQAAATASPLVDFWLCSIDGIDHYCFRSNAFPANPNGIVVFNSCGSDFGFNNTGAGASVGWTGTTQRAVAERTAAKFWELMVTDGVEFELAKEIVQGGGYDSHLNTYWASDSVNAFTSAAFQGRNLRARDVIEARIDGDDPRGQVVQFNGLPEDGRAETFPAKGQQITFEVEGVRNGTERGVTIEIRGDGDVWKSDVNLGRDGTIKEQRDGYATWQVTLDPDEVEIPDLSWGDLAASRAPVELEVRAFERSSEYTAVLGTIRLGTDVEFTGPLPIFEELEAGLPAGGQLTGNDLRVRINTGTGQLTGSMNVELSGFGLGIGTWQLQLTGAYDTSSGAVSGTVEGQAEGGIFDIRASDAGSGTFEGQANLEAETVQIQLGIGGSSQVYNGTVVRD